MKKAGMCIAALLCAAVVAAQTPEERAASQERIVVLEQPAPDDCGVKEIDDAVAKCKSVAEATVAIAGVTSALSEGAAEPSEMLELADRVESTVKSLAEAVRQLAEATGALKGVKNPMKVKSCKRSLDYAQSVSAAAPEELAYQGRLIGSIVSGE